jgi:hypothetical protein
MLELPTSAMIGAVGGTALVKVDPANAKFGTSFQFRLPMRK